MGYKYEQFNPVNPVYMDATTKLNVPVQGDNGALNVRMTESVAIDIAFPVEARAIKGTVSTQAPTGLMDASKDFEADVFKDKLIVVRHDEVDYIRKITGSTGSTLLFPALIAEVAEVPAVAASVEIGSGENPEGKITINAVTAGEAGNALKVQLVDGSGESQPLAAAYDAETHILTITSSTDGSSQVEPILAGNVGALLSGIPAIAALYEVDVTFTAGGLPTGATVYELTGGADTVPAVPAVVADEGDEYAILL